MPEVFVAVFGALFVMFLIFLIARELMCWYWKINRIVTLMESMNSKLSRLGVSEGALAADEQETCPFCKELSSKSDPVCELCGQQKR